MIKRNAEEDLAICNAATPGHWNRVDNNLGCKTVVAEIAPSEEWGLITFTNVGYTHGLSDERQDEANAQFVATSRTALPHWIDRAAKAEAEVERLRGALIRVVEWLDLPNVSDQFTCSALRIAKAALCGGEGNTK